MVYATHGGLKYHYAVHDCSSYSVMVNWGIKKEMSLQHSVGGIQQEDTLFCACLVLTLFVPQWFLRIFKY